MPTCAGMQENKTALFVCASLEFISIILFWIIVLLESNFFRVVTTLFESEKIIYLLYVDLSMYEGLAKWQKLHR